MNDVVRLQVRHETRYVFDAPVRYGVQQLRKSPKSSRHQSVVSWTTNVVGGSQELTFEDHNRNTVELVRFDRDVTQLVIACNGTVDLTDNAGVVGRHEGPAALRYYQRQTSLTRPGRQVRALANSLDDADDVARLHALSAAVRASVQYEVGASDPDWTAEQIMTEGRGVCQDHAHVFLSAARVLGFPARYVSGYLMLDDRTTQEAMHAWAEVHVQGLGWVGYDVSNAISPDSRYIRVATGLDYAEAAPVTGLRTSGVPETLTVEIKVAQQ
jgi:transglutaminase-like putative cysteine protease